MALVINSAHYFIHVLGTLISHIVDDWRATVWTIQHAWMAISMVGWRKIVLGAIVVGLVSVVRIHEMADNISSGQRTSTQDGDAVLDCVSQPLSEAQMLKHLYLDGTGLPDYAAQAAGAQIVYDLTSPTYAETAQPNTWIWTWKQPHGTERSMHPPPESAILPDTSLGSCWPMRGSHGTLGVALALPIAISSFTIDHIPRSIAIYPNTAPRSGELWGVVAKNGWPIDLGSGIPSNLLILNSSAIVRHFDLPGRIEQLYSMYDFVHLVNFTYDLDHHLPFQTFHLPVETSTALGDTRFGIVLLVISDNWGDQDLTCVYRIRVHPK